jgi:glycosyltransferase involved in cell wall biosynthesis
MAMKIAFLIRSMAVGGTQRQLSLLCRELQRRGHQVSVLLYYVGAPMDSDLREYGVPIVDLRKGGRWRNLRFLLRLRRALQAERPDVLYAYLPASNLLALLVRLLHRGCAVACGVRGSGTAPADTWLTRAILLLERWSLVHADVIIANSQAAARQLARGYRHDNVVVIDNGIDMQEFSFDAGGRRRTRLDWQVSDATPVVGCVARLDPLKDHGTLLRAFAQVCRTRPEARLVCVGTITEPYGAQLRALAQYLQVDHAVRWIDRAANLTELYSGLDALCLSSASEGFPNVIAEAMACGVPCVATDVGEVRRILSASDFLVPPRDPDALARALLQALAQGRSFSEPRTERIRREFSPGNMAEKTEQALRGAVARGERRARGWSL